MGVDKLDFGVMAKFVLVIKLKWITSFLKTNIPVFHHSIIPIFKNRLEAT